MSGQFLRSVILAGAAAALLAVVPEGASAQTVDGPKVTWKVGTWGKRRAVTEGMELLAAHVKERTGGKFTMTIGYESFGAPKELLDVLSVGVLSHRSDRNRPLNMVSRLVEVELGERPVLALPREPEIRPVIADISHRVRL